MAQSQKPEQTAKPLPSGARRKQTGSEPYHLSSDPYPDAALDRERNLIEVLKKELKEWPWSKETRQDLARHKAMLRAMERKNFLARQLSFDFPSSVSRHRF